MSIETTADWRELRRAGAAGSGVAVETGDGWPVVTGDGSLAAHYEHTLVITRERPVLLTAA